MADLVSPRDRFVNSYEFPKQGEIMDISTMMSHKRRNKSALCLRNVHEEGRCQ